MTKQHIGIKGALFMWAVIAKWLAVNWDKVLGGIFGAAGLIWDWFTNKEAETAREIAAMWRGLFCFAVIIIVVLAFIIIRNRQNRE